MKGPSKELIEWTWFVVLLLAGIALLLIPFVWIIFMVKQFWN